MNNLTINPKFKELLPALSEDERKQLEESLLNEGCRDAILTWRNQIVDGHNRHELCGKHDLPYRINEMPFADEDEALEWIYTNQLGRRNLSDHQRTHYIGKLYNLRKNRHGALEANKNAVKNEEATVATSFSNKAKIKGATVAPLISNNPTTAEQIAKETGVSARTVRNAGKVVEVLETAPLEIKQDFLAGKITQKEVLQSADIPMEEREDKLAQIAQLHSERIYRKLHELHEAIKKAQTVFDCNGIDFDGLAPRLASWKPETLKTQARSLAKIVSCDFCLNGCDRCNQKGYKTN